MMSWFKKTDKQMDIWQELKSQALELEIVSIHTPIPILKKFEKNISSNTYPGIKMYWIDSIVLIELGEIKEVIPISNCLAFKIL